jgi:hypothetical protein
MTISPFELFGLAAQQLLAREAAMNEMTPEKPAPNPHAAAVRIEAAYHKDQFYPGQYPGRLSDAITAEYDLLVEAARNLLEGLAQIDFESPASSWPAKQQKALYAALKGVSGE